MNGLLYVMASVGFAQLSSQQFSMHYTEQVYGQVDYDCLSYTVPDDIYRSEEIPLFQHQNILYCFRPREPTTDNGENLAGNDTSFTIVAFKQLKVMHVTTDHLFEWSAPIDLIERYAAYLQSDSRTRDDYPFFCNCTTGWFGPRCQYTFESNASFSAIVKSAFQNRSTSQGELPNPSTTCYTHLSCKYGGSEFACLDWREVCDGKVDCADGGNDEKHCLELEMNECDENEYRCQNGLCVAHEFFRDGIANPECLDRTDEYLASYPAFCASDPSFRCEEHLCKVINERRELVFSCGDGQCVQYDNICTNKRNILIPKFDIYAERYGRCWTAMACLTQFLNKQMKALYDEWCGNLSTTASQTIIREHCPSLFEFPTALLTLGHVRLFYKNNSALSSQGYLLPQYICYRQDLCINFPHTVRLQTSNNESLTCQYWDESMPTVFITHWLELVRAIQIHFRPCSTFVSSDKCQETTHALFRCANTTKCISTHRLVDDVSDCPRNEDETYNNSCAIGNKYRRKCLHDGRCLAPTMINDMIYQCSDGSDERDDTYLEQRRRISFQTLCNRFVDMASMLINGREQTDETNCEHWIRDNAYTRNDGYWNCPNGQDELPYPPSFTCSSSEHFCIDPMTYNLSCLSISKVNDGKVDCIGGTDERHICRRQEPNWLQKRFLCGNNVTTCAATLSLCGGRTGCPRAEEERFCKHKSVLFCNATLKGKRSLIEEFICQLDDSRPASTLRYFSLHNFPDYPHSTSSGKHLQLEDPTFPLSTNIQPISHSTPVTWPSRWRCNRGLNIRVHQQFKCICPPSYYGDLCQYQNQRISLSLQIHTVAEVRVPFALVITLVDSDGRIHSSDQLSYLALRDCNVKFSIYLLYATRPKDPTKTYAVRIDAYEKDSLLYRSTWLFPTRFDFLPVHRMAVRLNISFMPAESACTLKCNHGRCRHAQNNRTVAVCQCDDGWWGQRCEKVLKCHCSPQSRCLGSICLCRTERFGPRCYLTRTVCASQPCQNGGLCVPGDLERRAILPYTCLCKEGYSGDRCELINTRIGISFQSSIRIPTSILVHFISIYNGSHPVRITALRKIAFNQDSAMAYTSRAFRLIFVQFDDKFHLIYHRTVQSLLSHISTVVQDSHRCLSITELFNATVLELNTLHRIKYYHLPCQQHLQLVCFYGPLYTCLCTTDRRADCFEFDSNVTSNCEEEKICENEGQCFRDDSVCPKTVTCGCQPCFYGSRCQFSTKGIGLSLDVILGSHIQVKVPFQQQPSILFASISIATLLFVAGLVDGFLSIWTFKAPKIRQTACGLYLLATSITSLFVITALALKMALMIVSQMGTITHRSFLLGHCIIMDSLVRVLLSAGDWLRACVCVELAFTICKGVTFDPAKSKRTAKLVIGFVYLFTVITTLHEPLHRQLMDDLEEKRTWCVATYSSVWNSINSAFVLLHFLAPFIINILAGLLIIVMAARRRSTVQQNLTKGQHLRAQFHQHKKLLISPCVLVILTTPRLIISFTSGCMRSSRQSSLLLAGYLLSFIPPMLTIAVFVLPSATYKQQFLRLVTTKRQRLHQTERSNPGKLLTSMNHTANN